MMQPRPRADMPGKSAAPPGKLVKRTAQTAGTPGTVAERTAESGPAAPGLMPVPTAQKLRAFLSDWLHHRLGLPYRLHVHGDTGGRGPVVILLHGIASSSVSWRDVVPLLAPHYRCITIDLLGFGASPKPGWNSYTPDQHVKQLHYTIRKLRLRGPVILAGHSLGSLLALHYASMHPGRVMRVMLLSPPVYIDPLEIIQRHVRAATNAYLSAYKYIRTHKQFTITNAARVSRMLPVPGSLVLNEANWLPFSRSLEMCIERQTVDAEIRQLGMPVDIFYGVFDEFIIKANVVSLGLLPHVTLRRLAASHMITRGYARAFAGVLVPAVAGKEVGRGRRRRMKRVPEAV